MENVDVGARDSGRIGSRRDGRNTYRSMVMSEDKKYTATEHLLPTKIFGPNLEGILNAAGFYRRKPLTEEKIEEIWAEFADLAGDLPCGNLSKFVSAIEREHGIKSDE